MKTKFLIALMALFTVFSVDSFGQERPSKEQMENMKAQREADVAKLNLSDEQKPKFDEISKRYGDQLRAIRNEDLTREDKKAKAEPLMEAKNKEMKALLDESQYKTYMETQKQRKKQMKKRAH